jgi:hypothetical protein
MSKRDTFRVVLFYTKGEDTKVHRWTTDVAIAADAPVTDASDIAHERFHLLFGDDVEIIDEQ